MDEVDSPEQAAALDQPPLLVREPLAAFLDSQGLGAGPVKAERIGEGHSNVTYLVRRAGARVVLRRPPRPPLPPSAHDVLREARLLRALEPTAARVPRVLAVCEDESVLGVPFYVMEEVTGAVITREVPAALDAPPRRRAIGEELVDALAEIHAVDREAAGLDWLGRPSGYLERQLRRFGGLWEHSATRDVPAIAEVETWLAANLPESPAATIVHGDYRLGNAMVGLDPPVHVEAVFDWELATIGDPLADVGYLTATWSEAGDPEDRALGALSAATRLPGFPSRAELVARYEERSGRSVAALAWYQALAIWKAAIFMEGNYRAYVEGRNRDPYLERFDEGVPALAEQARAIAERGPR